MNVRSCFAAAAAALLGLGLVAGPSSPAPAAAPAAATSSLAQPVTVTIDPSYQQPEFQGWGTSLAWLAEVTGGYPEAIRKKLADMVFGPDGLNLNIARYNIGGGNAPTVRDYLRPGGAVPGFWKASAAYGPNDKEWWDPNNPADWNFNADPNQRWWVDQVKSRVTEWEAFSNSPPYFQTVSGYVSGGFNSGTDQIRADRVDQFADYLVQVTDHLEAAHGIKFDSIEPLNESNTTFWKTTLGADGQPTGGRQEGAHAGPALQAQVVQAVQRRLASAHTKAIVAAPDETNPGTFVTDWYGYPAAAQQAVSRLNVHTYGTAQRTSARDLAKAEQLPLWMSEVEGSWGTDFTSMDSGLGMARLMIDDIRELEPSAWVLWQPIEDAKNMVAEGNLQWGSIHVPFDCTATDTLKTCPIRTNTKYDTIRNFTHYIHPGDHMVKVNDKASVAAIAKSGKAATVVHTNAATTPQQVTLDLTKFGTISQGATVTPVVTSTTGKLVRGTSALVTGGRATLTVPAQSVTTFLVSGVSSVAPAAEHIQPGHTYRIQGVQSGRSLAADATIRTTDTSHADQLWRISALGDPLSSRGRYQVTNASTGQRLAVRAGAVVAEAPAATDTAAQWELSTTGDGTYTLINVGARRVLDVPGKAVTDGTAVGVNTPTSGDNQRWTLRDETISGTTTVTAYTVPGRTPALPATVTATTYSGEPLSLAVTWRLPPARQWRRPGTVTVPGTVTDIVGRVLPARATVTVDTFTSTSAGRAKTFVGGSPALPATVVGLGRNGGHADLPVAWNPAPAGAFERPGVATVTGTATVVDGTRLPATAQVQITVPTETTVATDGVAVTATYTESGYSTAGLTNGDTTDKAWSNWKSADGNPSDTLTVSLPRPVDATRMVIHFYRDNSAGGGLPQSLQVGVPGPDGACVPSGAQIPVGVTGGPAVEAPLAAGPTTAVCLILTAMPNGYLTVAELQLFAKSPGVSADATVAGISVDGVPIRGFNPAVTSYRVAVAQPGRAKVTATATDPYAKVTTSRHGSRQFIIATSEDGKHKTAYQVFLVRRQH